MLFNYTIQTPVWQNTNYFEGILRARELRSTGQDRDLYKNFKLYRHKTRDVDTGAQFAYKCAELVDYGRASKVHDWENTLVDIVRTKYEGYVIPEDAEAAELYDAFRTFHTWGKDDFSGAVHGVHVAYLDLATQYKLDLSWAKAQQFNSLFE